jgi:sulfate permease, SulP family
MLRGTLSSFLQLKNYIPKSIVCLRDYSFSTFSNDLAAGSTVGILAFSLAMAYAIGAGVSPERGIFTAIVAGFLISLLGGSRVQIGGPAGAFIVAIYDIITRHGIESLVVVTFLAGLILIFFGLFGLGTFIKYIPYPVTTGLTTGIAVVIFSSQIKDFFGLNIAQVPPGFKDKWMAYFNHFTTWDPISLGVGLGSIGLMIWLRRVRPSLPGAIITVFVASLVTWLFNLDIETIGSKYGSIPRVLPSPSWPHFSFDNVLTYFPDALTIALLAGIESLLSAVISEGMTGWRFQSNCELVGVGLANIGSCIFGGIPAAAATARTAMNVKCGAKTPISGMIHSLTIFLVMYLFAPLATKIPLTAIAAVLLMVSWTMSEIHHFLHLFSAPKKDIVVLITVFLLTVLVGITVALQVGMILAAFLFMKQMSDLSDVISIAPFFDESQKEESSIEPIALNKKEIPQEVEIYEIRGPFFFGVADRLKNLLNSLERPPKVFILRMKQVPTIDASGMHALEEFFIECKRQHILLLLSGVRKNPLNDLKRFRLDLLIGQEHIFPHIHQALRFAKNYLDSLTPQPLLPTPNDANT